MTNWKKYINRPWRFVYGGTAIGIGIGFTRYFNHMVMFPVFPNILDSLFMIGIGCLLFIDAFNK